MRVVTYEERVSLMVQPNDVAVQTLLAKIYLMRLRGQAKKPATLAVKLEVCNAIKEAESVLRKLRLNVFELENMLKARNRLEEAQALGFNTIEEAEAHREWLTKCASHRSSENSGEGRPGL